MCASYHLRGSCKILCPRAADHIPHSLEEDHKLFEWCTKAFELKIGSRLIYGTRPALPPLTTSPTAKQNPQEHNSKRLGESSREASPPALLQDSVGKLVSRAITAFRQHDTLEQYLRSLQTHNDIHPLVQQIPHPAASLFHGLHSFGASAHLTDSPGPPNTR
jgi:hypothetical protein